MNDRELDRAIDAAAHEMMAREPSGALGHNVMAHVREDAAPASRRPRWVLATASVVLCAAIAIALLNRAPATVSPALPPIRSAAAEQPVVASRPPMPVAPDTATRREAPIGIAVRAAPPVTLPGDISPIAPLETEPIVFSTIDVPVLERETAVIDVLTVEPLTIEPLAASND